MGLPTMMNLVDEQVGEYGPHRFPVRHAVAAINADDPTHSSSIQIVTEVDQFSIGSRLRNRQIRRVRKRYLIFRQRTACSLEIG